MNCKKKKAEERIIDAAIRWYNIGVEDGRKWEAANQKDNEIIEIDEDGNINHKVNILRDPEGEYALTGGVQGEISSEI